MFSDEEYYEPTPLNEEVTENKIIRPSVDLTKEMRLDNTKRSKVDECPRKFQLAHVFGLKSQYGSTALRYGSTWHGFQEGYYGTIKELGWDNREQAITNALILGKKVWDETTAKQQFFNDYRTLENGCAAFIQYITHFENDQTYLKVVDTEQVFAVNIVLQSELEKRLFSHLPPIVFTGKLDLQVYLNSLPWIVEFKTTGMSLSQMTTRLTRSAQVLGYSYAAPEVLNFKPVGALVSFHYLFSRKGKDGDYGKVNIDFDRTPQVFNQHDIEEWRMSFLSSASKIYQYETQGYYPMNWDDCFSYNRQCAFYRLCTQDCDAQEFNENTPEGYIVDPWDVEAEIGGDDAT